jgi:predicted permease
MLMRPLPVWQPDRLANLEASEPNPGSQTCNQAGDCDNIFIYPMFRDLKREQTVFTALAAHRAIGVSLAFRGQTCSGDAMLVSGSYFPALAIQPAIGRLLGPGDDRAIGESPVVVLSYDYWRTRFDADPAVIDQTLTVNGQPMTIVGVAPRDFNGTTLGARPQVFVPLKMTRALQPNFKGFDDRRDYWLYLFARLKPGVSIEQAQTAINVPYHSIVNDVEAPLQTGMSDQTMARFRAKRVSVEQGARGQSSLHVEARAPLTLLFGVTGLVLLIACANIANLLLARAATRTGEMAVRLSIGAGRWQLISQLLTESCLLAAFGGLAGLLVAGWTLDLIASLLPADALGTVQFRVDATATAFAAALTLATGLLFGLFPALHTTRPDVISALKGQSGQPAGARAAARFRTVLATAQIALSMALLVAAGLFTRSLFNVSRVDLGLKVDNVVTFRVSPALNGYTSERSLALFERLEDELGAVPGVTGVSGSLVPLLSDSSWGNNVAVEGFEAGPDTDTNSRYNAVGPGYLQTLGMSLLAGREFTRADAAGAPKVAIVNEEFAKKFNLGRDAVGKRMARRRDKTLDMEIVGLVKDTKYNRVRDPVPPLVIVPYRQFENLETLSFYVRTSLDPEQMLSTVPKIVARLDPNLPVEELRTMPEQVRENVFVDRFITVLSAAFAGLATLLAAVGLYGVLAYTVAQRTREIGLRMALGATPDRVRGMVMWQVGRMVVIGGVTGLAAAVGLGRAAQAMLFELQGYDPAVLAAAAVGLTLIALGAGFVPALRASRIDPMRALRYE